MSANNFNSEDPTMELQSLKAKSDHITDKSLESTRRMRQLAISSQDTGAKTLEMLEGQGKQFDDIEQGLDKISADMKKADKNISRMERWWSGLIPSRSKKEPEADLKKDTNPGGARNRNDPGKVLDRRQLPAVGNQNGPSGSADEGYIQKITNDDREDEMNENLKEVSGILGSLKHMALDMGAEIQGRDGQLHRIHTKMLANQGVIADANVKATKLLKS